MLMNYFFTFKINFIGGTLGESFKNQSFIITRNVNVLFLEESFGWWTHTDV